jgi:hypothetical protein
MAKNNYQFRQNLLQVHRPNRRMTWVEASENDVEITDNWTISIPETHDTILYNAAKDLEDYFAVSMSVFPKVVVDAKARNIIEYQINPRLGKNKYQLVVEKEHISLVGFDSKSAARAGYFLEDLLNLNEGPFVKYQDTTREYLYCPRMVHSGYGLDMFPTEYLKQMAHAGFTSLLLYVNDVNKTPHGEFDFNELIERAENHGIDVYVYSRIWNRMYPEGEEAEKYYDNLYGRLFRSCPKLKGIVFVGESFEFPSKDEHSSGIIRIENRDANGKKLVNKPNPGWWPCYDYPLMIEMVKKPIRAANPDADIVFWTYNWGKVGEKYRLALLENIPTDISLLVTFEMFEDIPVDDVVTRVCDYSLYFEGPGKYFVSEAKLAKERGIRLYAMTNTGGRTWDLGTVPYEPAPYQWLKRYNAMKDCHDKYGLCGTMDSHHYGWYPSFISDFAKWMFETPDANPDEILRKIAIRDFSEVCADDVLNAWQLFSEGIDNLTSTGKDQYGPLRVGPAYPLLLFKEGFVFQSPPRTLHGGNCICFPMYTYKDLDENLKKFMVETEMHKKVARLFDDGADLLESTLDKIHQSKVYYAKQEIGLARFIANTAKTSVNVRRWYLLKQELSNEDADVRRNAALQMKEIGENEIQNAIETIQYVNFDSRLGFEPSMLYMTDEDHIRDKIDATRRVLDEELSEYLK